MNVPIAHTPLPLSIREAAKLEIDRWLNECGEQFEWTTTDVLDFVDCSFVRIQQRMGTQSRVERKAEPK